MTISDASLPRLLDQAEAFFWLLDRHSAMNFSVIAEGSGALSAAEIAAALPQLQARHPLLTVAITLDEAGRLIFQPAPEKHAVLTHTTHRTKDWHTQLARATVQPFALATAPLFRAHLYLLPDEHWVLALTFHHSIADARSAFTVLRELLELAGGTSPPLPAIAPRPSLLTLYPPHWRGAAGQAAAATLKAIKRDENKQAGSPATLPAYQELLPLLQPEFISLRHSPPQLQAMLARAKAEQTTLHGLIGAAQLLAIRQQIDGNGEKLLGLTSPADLRPSLEPAMDTHTPGFYVTLLAPSFMVGGPEDFWPLAREISARNRRDYLRGDGHHLYHFYPPAESFAPTAEGQAAFDAMMLRGHQSSVLSNVGGIPAFSGLRADIQVERLSFCLSPAPKQPIFTSVTSYADRLTLNISYDSARLPEHLARQIAHMLDHWLRWASSDQDD